MTSRRFTALYISYDGMTDPLGQSQVTPYAVGLSDRGFGCHILSCEKPQRLSRLGAMVATDLSAHGIRWTPLAYTARPPILSTIYDMARLWRSALMISARESIDLVHCRGYVPMVVGRRLARRLRVPFIFDTRAFWPEEKVDAGAWRLSNPVYRAVYTFFKQEERRALAAADAIVVLTDAARAELVRRGVSAERISVIPCSVDFELFILPAREERTSARRRLGIDPASVVLSYVGSVGTWYMLEEMFEFFAVLRAKLGNTAHFLIITPAAAVELEPARFRTDIPRDSISVVSAARQEVPGYLAAGDIGLSFIRPTASKVSSSPTKIGEYLAMGLPVLTNRGIGDTDEIIRTIQGGVLLDSFTPEGYAAAADQIVDTLGSDREGLRTRARAWFDLDLAVARYESVYTALTDRETR